MQVSELFAVVDSENSPKCSRVGRAASMDFYKKDRQFLDLMSSAL